MGPKTYPFTKIGDLKTDPSQKSETLKRTLKLKIIMENFTLVLPQMSLQESYKKISLNYIFSQKMKEFFTGIKVIFTKLQVKFTKVRP